MKCPNCGEELKEGYLYCEKCGEDIHMVPDFEPEIEYSIHKTLEGIVEEVADKPKSEEKLSEADKVSKKEKRKNKILIGICLALVVGILVAALIGVIIRYQYNSIDYQLQKAYACMSKDNLEEAKKYYERAVELDDKNAGIRLDLASICYELGQETEYLDQLKIVAKANYSSDEDLERAYSKLISFYHGKENYQAINSLLLDCTVPDIVNEYQNYLAKMPEFSYQEGTYAEVVPLKLSSNTSGVIYYTLDGTAPDRNSEVYTAPIFLETGDYVVSALFINDYGIISETAVKKYHIDVMKPAAPEVHAYSGEYTYPVLIEVDVQEGCSVYYTTDGSTPTNQSIQYQDPIPMPLGKSRYKFIMYNEEGVAGEITAREYDLTLQTEYTVNNACEDLVNAMLERGKIYDAWGNSYEVEGKYKYIFQYALSVPDQGDYYVIAEVYEDTAGIQTKTGTNYAVNVYSGVMYKLETDVYGNNLLQGF